MFPFLMLHICIILKAWFSGIMIYFFLMGTTFMGCFTEWTNEFMGSYSNYNFIISHSIFNRMALWRTLCLQSNIEEVLCLSSSISISSLWFSSLSYF